MAENRIDGNIGLLISGFIILLVGIALTQVLADNVKGTESSDSVINESITIASTRVTIINESVTPSGGIVRVTNSPIMSITRFGNDTQIAVLGQQVNHSKPDKVLVANNFTGTYNISYTFAKDADGKVATNTELLSITRFGAANISSDIAGITIGTHINFTANSRNVRVSAFNFTDDNYNISYTKEGNLYVANKTSRTLLVLIPLFFVIALVMISVGVSKKFWPEMGI